MSEVSVNKKTEYKIGNIDIPVTKTQRPEDHGRFGNIIKGFLSLLKGMKVTAYYFFNPKEVVTQQYPENRETLKIADRFRAELILKKDENGYLNCTGCKICAQNCPNASIEVIDMKGMVKKREIDRYIWHMDTCIFCNICVQVCPFDALEMKNTFESSAFDRRLFTYQLNPYAGPTKKNISKLESEEQERLTHMIERNPYEGPVPLGVNKGIEASPLVEDELSRQAAITAAKKEAEKKEKEMAAEKEKAKKEEAKEESSNEKKEGES